MSQPPTDPIDWDHLSRFTMSDAGIEREVLSLFLEQTDLWSRALNLDATPEDWRTAAHTLKGTAKGVGAFALAKACETAEDYAEGSTTARAVARNDILSAMTAAQEAARQRIHWRDHS